MHILFISSAYPPFRGGSELYVKELSEQLVRQECKVTVLTTNAASIRGFRYNDDRFENLGTTIESGVKIIRIPIKDRFQRILNLIRQKHGGWRFLNFLLNDWIEMYKMAPAASGFFWRTILSSADCIIATNIYNLPAYYGLLASKLKRVPFVIVPLIHTEAHSDLMPIGYRLLSLSDSIIALTKYEKDYLIINGIDEKKIHVIGVGTNAYKHTNSSKMKSSYNLTVGFISRFVKGKGLDTLISAMRIVWATIPSVNLVIAGPTPRSDDIIEENLKYLTSNEMSKVTLIYDFSEKEKGSIISTFDIFAMPSKVESFGIVYLEAWCHKLPVIGCWEGASSSLIEDGVDGILTKYGDAENLAKAIILLAEQPQLRRVMGENGKKKVMSNYTWNRIAKKVHSLCYNPKSNNSMNA